MMAPTSGEVAGKARESRQEGDLVDLEAASHTRENELATGVRNSLRISRIGIANNFQPSFPTTPIRTASLNETDIISPSPASSLELPLHPASTSPSRAQSPSSIPLPSTPPPRNYRSSIAKAPTVGLGLDMAFGDDTNSSNVLPFNPNMSRFNRSDSSASSQSSGGSPYRDRISQISFSYPRRSPSAASTTLRATHPYGLYQQTTFEEPEDIVDDEDVSATSVGLGGRPANFRRRRGADGEEMDVIGPDGHAEQLPPYTRYPEAGPSHEKLGQSDPNTAATSLSGLSIAGPSSASNPIPSSTSTVTPSSDIVASADALTSSSNPLINVGSIPTDNHTDSFLAMGQPQSQPSPLELPLEQSPTLSNVQTEDGAVSRGAPSSASSLVEQKNREAWRKKGHKRVLCGTIPLWSVLLFAILCIFLAVIAGGVIGGMVSQQKSRNNHGGDTVTITNAGAMYDASPIAAPTGMPPLPTGTFFFPLGAPAEQERRCMDSPKDYTSWSCTIQNQLLLIDFGGRMGNYPTAKMYPAPSPKGMEGVQYGAQPPKGNPIQKLQWVIDTRDRGRGPALWFQTIYNKVVVIEGEKFPPPDIHLKRDMENVDLTKRDRYRPDRKDYDGPAPSMSLNPNVPTRYASKPGEEPWYCFWNGTTIEGYIFMSQSIAGADTQQFTASQITTETATPTAAISNSVATATLTDKPLVSATSPQVSARAVMVPRSPGARDATTSIVTTPPARFPFIVKIDERRFPNVAFAPYCQQMVVNSDGIAIPKIGLNGQKVVENIREPSWGNRDNKKKYAALQAGANSNLRASTQQSNMFRRAIGEFDLASDGRVVKRDSMPSNGCHCQWLSPSG